MSKKIIIVVLLLLTVGVIIYFLKFSNINEENQKGTTEESKLETSSFQGLFSFDYPKIWGETKLDTEEISFSHNPSIFVRMASWQAIEDLYKEREMSEDVISFKQILKQIFEQKNLQGIELKEGEEFPFLFDSAISTKYNFQYLASPDQNIRGILFSALESYEIPGMNGHLRYIGYNQNKDAVLMINYALQSEKKEEIEKKYESGENLEKYEEESRQWLLHLSQDSELKDVEKIIKYMVCSTDRTENNICSLEGVDMSTFKPTLSKEEAITAARESLGENKDKYTTGEAYGGPYGEKSIPAWVVFMKAEDHLYEIFINQETGEILEKRRHELPSSTP